MRLQDLYEFQCKICFLQFDNYRCVPNIICPNGHLVCHKCLHKISYGQKRTPYDCPFCKVQTTAASAVDFKKLLKIRKIIKLLTKERDSEAQLKRLIQKQRNELRFSSIQTKKELNRCQEKLFKATNEIMNLTANYRKVKYEQIEEYQSKVNYYQEQVYSLKSALNNQKDKNISISTRIQDSNAMVQKLKEEIRVLIQKFEQQSQQCNSLKKVNQNLLKQKMKVDSKCQHLRKENINMYQIIKSYNQNIIKNDSGNDQMEKKVERKFGQAIIVRQPSQKDLKIEKVGKQINIKAERQASMVKDKISKKNGTQMNSTKERSPK